MSYRFQIASGLKTVEEAVSVAWTFHYMLLQYKAACQPHRDQVIQSYRDDRHHFMQVARCIKEQQGKSDVRQERDCWH